MSLSIGDISFGIEADTSGLKQSITLLKAFQKTVDAAADAVDEFGQGTVNAYSKQESAIKRALQQTLNLQRALKAGGAPGTEINKVTAAFVRLNKELTSGKLSTVQYTRAIDGFNARINRSARELKNLKAKRANTEVGGLVGRIRDLQSASVLALGPLSGLGARITAIGAIANRETLKLAAFTAGLVGVGVGAFKLTGAIINAGREMQRIESILRVAVGQSGNVGAEFEYVTRVANDLGLELTSVAKQYAQLAAASKGTALEGESIRRVFESVAKAGAALKLSNEQVEGAFRAVQQIISKGTVQAEELRGQFAERVVGGFQLAAKAMNLTTKELGEFLKKGAVTADVLLPHLAVALEDAFGAEALNNVNTLTGAQNILNTQFLLFANNLDDILGVTDASVKATQALGKAMLWLNRNLNLVIASITAVAAGFAALAAPAIIRGTIALGGAILRAAQAFSILSLAMLANPAGALLASLGKLALFLTGATAGFWAMNEALESSSLGTQQLTADMKELQKTRVDTRIGEVTREIARLESQLADFETRSLTERIFGKATEGGELKKRLQFAKEILEGLRNAQSEMAEATSGKGLATALPKIDFGAGDDKLFKRIEKRIELLEFEAQTFGDTAEFIKLYRLELDGATKSQLERAKSALESVQADKEFARAVKESEDAVKKENAEYQKFIVNQKKVAVGIVESVDAYARFNREMKELDRLTRMFPEHQEAFLKAGAELRKQLDEEIAKSKELDQVWQDIGGTIAEAFGEAITEGKSLGDVLKGLEQDLLAIGTRELITKPLTGVFAGIAANALGGGGAGGGAPAGGGATGGGGFLSSIMSFFGGSASGSFQHGRERRVVGENGPELWEPSVGGRIIPNGQMAMAGGGRTNNIDLTMIVQGVSDPTEFARSEPQILSSLHNRLNDTLRDL